MANEFTRLTSHDDFYRLFFRAIRTERAIFIQGPDFVGKTKFVRHFALSTPSLYVECRDVSTASNLFCDICDALKQSLSKSSRTTRSTLPTGILSSSQFKSKYASIIKTASNPDFYLILDDVHFWNKTKMAECLKTLLTTDNLYVIMTSKSSQINFIKNNLPRLLASELANLCMPAWSNDDLNKVILLEAPRKHAKSYELFVNNCILLLKNKSYPAVKYFCQKHFTEAIKCHGDKTLKGDQAGIMIENLPFNSIKVIESVSPGDNVVTGTFALLVATYVAAYTKPSDDKRNFLMFQKRNTKKMKRDFIEADDKSRPFTLERLLNIYEGVLKIFIKSSTNEKVFLTSKETSDAALGNLSFLQEMGFLRLASGNGFTPCSRFRIADIVTRNYIDSIAEKFEVHMDHFCGLQ